MGFKVPMLDRQVAETPQLINAPKISPPVEGAFGESIAVATKNLGKSISGVSGNLMDIGAILAKQKQELEKEKALETFSKVSSQSQDILFSTESEDLLNPHDPSADPRSFGTPVLDDNGDPIQVSKGVMNKTGNAAYDALSIWNQRKEEMVKKNTENLSPYAKQEFEKLWAPHSQSLDGSVMKYAVTQRNEAVKQNFYQFKDSTLANIGLLDEPHRLESIKNVNDRISELENIGRFTYEEAKKQREDFSNSLVTKDIVVDAAKSADQSNVLAELNKGNDGRYNFLSPEQNQDLKKKALEKIKLNVQFDTELKVNNRSNVLQQFANGKIDYLNSADIAKTVGIEDPELGEAIKNGSDGLFMPANEEANFAALAKDIFESSSKEEINKFIINSLNANPDNRISRGRLAILINSGVERQKELKISSASQTKTLSSKQSETDAGVLSILRNSNPLFSVPDMIVNFFRAKSEGKSAQEAHYEAVKSEINRNNPLSVRYKIGDIVTNPKTGQSAEVIGINDNGSPVLKRKVNGK